MKIVVDDLSRPEVHALVDLHLGRMHEHSPPCKVHALAIDALRHPDVTFWTAWDDGELMGCGALKQLDPGHGEIKSMRTADRHLRRGVAAAILETAVDTARARGYSRLSLETGSTPAFEPALGLYRRRGFAECGPFGDYTDTVFSRSFTLDLSGPPAG
jgi:putative acetyltransferase